MIRSLTDGIRTLQRYISITTATGVVVSRTAGAAQNPTDFTQIARSRERMATIAEDRVNVDGQLSRLNIGMQS